MRWVPNLSVSLRVSLPLTIAVLLALPLAGWGQQELRSGKKGVTSPAPVTSTAVDADTQALDVAIKAGTVMSGCLLMQDGTSKYVLQNASGGYLQQGGGTCNITPPASTIPFRTLIGIGT